MRQEVIVRDARCPVHGEQVRIRGRAPRAWVKRNQARVWETAQVPPEYLRDVRCVACEDEGRPQPHHVLIATERVE